MNDADVFLPMLLAAADSNPSARGGTAALGYHQGLVLEWDENDGSNTIQINGQNFTDLRVLNSSDTIMLAAGDTVGILRYQTSYFVLGRISAPGAGSSLRVRSATIAASGTTASTSFTDLTGGGVGPTLTDVYIGSRRTCLVSISAGVFSTNAIGTATCQVTGASAISTADFNWAYSGAVGQAVGSPASWTVLTSADGLNPGLNTFQMKYAFGSFGGGTNVQFQDRNLTVFPL